MTVKINKVARRCEDFTLFLKKLKLKQYDVQDSTHSERRALISVNGIFSKELVESTVMLRILVLKHELLSVVLGLDEISELHEIEQLIKDLCTEADLIIKSLTAAQQKDYIVDQNRFLKLEQNAALLFHAYENVRDFQADLSRLLREKLEFGSIRLEAERQLSVTSNKGARSSSRAGNLNVELLNDLTSRLISHQFFSIDFNLGLEPFDAFIKFLRGELTRGYILFNSKNEFLALLNLVEELGIVDEKNKWDWKYFSLCVIISFPNQKDISWSSMNSNRSKVKTRKIRKLLGYRAI